MFSDGKKSGLTFMKKRNLDGILNFVTHHTTELIGYSFSTKSLLRRFYEAIMVCPIH